MSTPRTEARTAQAAQQIEIPSIIVQRRDLGMAAKLIYGVLWTRASRRPGTVAITLEGLGEEVGRTARAADFALSGLLKKDLVQLVSNRRGALALYVDVPMLESRPRIRRPDPQKLFVETQTCEDPCSYQPASPSDVPCQLSLASGMPPLKAPQIVGRGRDKQSSQEGDGPPDPAPPNGGSCAGTSEVPAQEPPFGRGEDSEVPAQEPPSRDIDIDIRDPCFKTVDLGSQIERQAKLQEGASGEERFVATLLALLPKLQRGPARTIARGLDAGWLKWDDVQRAIDWAKDHSESDAESEIAGKFVGAIKRKFREKHQQWPRRSEGGAS